ncbi:MAG: YbaK/EbsC family protein [Sedimentisphaerales bacterium]|nr:YbaK/EbsC family protein [Sedimentisphaerales bacterium]
MRVREFLDKERASYETLEHAPVFSSQGLAAIEHEPGKYVAKPVIVKADDRYIMCVLPAPRKVDLGRLKDQLDAASVTLADEDEIGKLFPDCELGAEPPFGNLYDLPTVMDQTLEQDDHIVFQAGTHGEALRLSMADYRRLVEPKVLEFTF